MLRPFSLVLALALPSLAALPAAAAPTAPTALAADPGKVICRNAVSTGSILVQGKTCRVASAWSKPAQDLEDEDDFGDVAALPLGRKLQPDEVVQVGSANWDKMPDLKLGTVRLPYWQLVSHVEEMLRKKQCTLAGQSAKSFDITVPYAVLLEPDGKTKRVLVSATNCAPLETLVAMTALAISERGGFKSSGDGQPRWRDGKLTLTLLAGR